MNKQTIITAALILCILLSIGKQVKSDDDADVPTISVTKLDISDKALRISYEIKNTSKQDIWICDSVSLGYNFEVFPHDDGQTLIVRKRLDIPYTAFWQVQPFGKYIRLHRGEKRIESLLLSVPVSCVYQYEPEPRKRSGRVVDAKRLSIEIGYYVGDLPEFFSEIIKETEKTDIDKSILLKVWFGGLVGFNDKNEVLGQRDEEILIPYTDQMLRGERALRIIKDDLRIPYKETNERRRYNPPELTACTRLEIQYEPSMLEYFYPHKSQQNFLNKEEIEYIGSEKVTIIKDINDINGLANELKQTKQMVGGIASEKSKANVIGYHDSKRVVSFIVYDDTTIDTEKKQRIKYNAELKSLRKFTPRIQPFELRMNCAANMKNLWYRLRFYNRAENNRVHSLRNFKLSDTDRFNDPKKTRDMKLDLKKSMRTSFVKQSRFMSQEEKTRKICIATSILFTLRH